MSTATSMTPRILIVGSSETGKSLLAKSIAREMESRGIIVTVYDPVMSEWSEHAFVTHDEAAFLEELKSNYESGEPQAVFIDEADTLLSISHKHNHWILTRGRHFGLHPYVITQRPALVAPTVRSQCNELYCYRVSKDDAILLADDFAHEGIKDATELNQGEYIHCYWRDKKKVVDKGKIF